MKCQVTMYVIYLSLPHFPCISPPGSAPCLPDILHPFETRLNALWTTFFSFPDTIGETWATFRYLLFAALLSVLHVPARLDSS